MQDDSQNKKQKKTSRTKTQYSVIQLALNQLKGIDMYGESVQLTYKGQGKYTTIYGGIITLLFYTFMAFYLWFTIEQIVNGSSTNTSSDLVVVSYFDHGEFYPSIDYDFDFMFGLGFDLDETYGYYSLNEVRIDFSPGMDEKGERNQQVSTKELNFEKCDIESIPYRQHYLEVRSINSFYCITDKNYSIYGDSTINYQKYLEISLHMCNSSNTDGIECKSDEEIADYFNQNRLQLFYFTQYIDFERETDMIITYLDDAIYQYIDTNRIVVTDLQFQSAVATVKDSVFQYGQFDQYDYFSIGRFDKYNMIRLDTDSKIASFRIKQDYHQLQASRQVYSFLSMLSDIGGIQTTFSILGLYFVSFIQRRRFMSALLKRIYQIQNKHSLKRQKKVANQEKVFSEENQNNKQNDSLLEKEPNISFTNRQKQQQNVSVLEDNVDQFNTPSHQKEGYIKARQQSNMQEEIKEKEIQEEDQQKEPQFTIDNIVTCDQNKKEREYKLSRVIKKKQTINENDEKSILMSIITRKRFIYKTKRVFEYCFCCLCFRNLNKLRYNKKLKKHLYYDHAEKQLKTELDVITLIKSIKNLKLISQIILSQRDRLLLRFQKQNLITSSSSSSDSEDGDFDTLKLMNDRNPFIRLVMYGKIKRMINSYKNNQLDPAERNLVRGLFVRKIKDFNEEQFEQKKNKQLYQKLMTRSYGGNQDQNGSPLSKMIDSMSASSLGQIDIPVEFYRETRQYIRNRKRTMTNLGLI